MKLGEYVCCWKNRLVKQEDHSPTEGPRRNWLREEFLGRGTFGQHCLQPPFFLRRLSAHRLTCHRCRPEKPPVAAAHKQGRLCSFGRSSATSASISETAFGIGKPRGRRALPLSRGAEALPMRYCCKLTDICMPHMQKE